MGLFSFIGKAAKAVGGLIGGPVGGAVKLAGGLLDHKATNVSGSKMQVLHQTPVAVSRGNPSQLPPFRPQVYQRGNTVQGAPVPRQILSSTPTMPGGGVATSSGVMPQNSAAPPLSYGGSGSRAVSRKRSTRSKTRSASSKKKKSTGRKLKFGSPAWRAKYMKHKKRK